MTVITHDPARRLRAILGVSTVDRLTTAEVQEEFRFPSRQAVRLWLRRWHVPIQKRGRTVLVDRRDIEAVFARQREKQSA